MDELQTALVAEIENYTATSPFNRLRDIDGSAMTRFYGKEFNESLRRHVVALLAVRGGDSGEGA